MKKRLLFIPIALLLVFIMFGCTSKVKEETTDVKDAVDKKIISYDEIVITPMEAFDIYNKEYPDKLVTRIELDKNFEVGSYVYKVEGHSEKADGVEVVAKEINIDSIKSVNTFIGEPGTICTESYIVVGADLDLNSSSAENLGINRNEYIRRRVELMDLFISYLV